MYHPDDCAALGMGFHPVAAGRFDGCGDKRDWYLRPEHLILSFIDRGIARERLAWGECRAVAGDVTVLWPGRWHELTEEGGKPLATWWINIDTGGRPALADAFAAACGANERQPVVRPADVRTARRLFAELVAGTAAVEALPPAHFYERVFAIAQLCGGAGWNAPVRRPPSLIARAEAAWRAEQYATLSPRALAGRLGVRPNNLLAAARAERGTTTARLVLAWKIERAQRLLAGGGMLSELKLAAVAAASGFASLSHFTRAFRAATGSNPGTYRAARRR